MKKINISTDYGKTFEYLIDDLLAIGVYSTTTTEYLNTNDALLREKSNINNNKFYHIDDAVLIRTTAKDNSRIDFLITENVCFEGLALISEHAFNFEFYDDFVTAFGMLETNQYEDEIWYD
ncbi:hypothetical protein [Yeosuana sp.]|uniref:hypothetical protein n=1 Tax=Yeosuana sp. TaxID=2529388 RepID=UPI004054B772